MGVFSLMLPSKVNSDFFSDCRDTEGRKFWNAEKPGRPGVLQTNAHQICALQEYQRHKAQGTEDVLILSQLFSIPEGHMFVERWPGALQLQLRFRNT